MSRIEPRVHYVRFFGELDLIDVNGRWREWSAEFIDQWDWTTKSGVGVAPLENVWIFGRNRQAPVFKITDQQMRVVLISMRDNEQVRSFVLDDPETSIRTMLELGQ